MSCSSISWLRNATFVAIWLLASAICLGANVIQDGGFEQGTAYWARNGGSGILQGSYPHSPSSWYAYGGDVNTSTFSSTGSVHQQVYIPANATTATLTFWRHIDTTETTTTASYDTLKLQIRNSSGTVLATIATYSNLDAAPGYSQASFNLLAYKGQTIQIYFVGVEDASLKTSFVLDDFALNVTTP